MINQKQPSDVKTRKILALVVKQIYFRSGCVDIYLIFCFNILVSCELIIFLRKRDDEVLTSFIKENMTD